MLEAHPIQLQFGIFFEETIKPEDLWLEIKKDKYFAGVFDKTPTIIPLPDDPDFNNSPSVIADSTSQTQLLIAKKRTDIVYRFAENPCKGFGEVRKRYEKNLTDFFVLVLAFIKQSKTKVNRLTTLTTFFTKAEEGNDALSKLLTKNPKDFHKSDEIDDIKIQFSTKDSFAGIDLFNITIIQRGNLKVNPEQKGIVVVRDINTRLDSAFIKKIKSSEDLIKFFNAIEEKMLIAVLNKELSKNA